MKLAAITAGPIYTNGRQRYRMITGKAPGLYQNQEDCDCVKYLEFTRRVSGEINFRSSACTRRAFASWAVRALDEGELPEVRAAFKSSGL